MTKLYFPSQPDLRQLSSYYVEWKPWLHEPLGDIAVFYEFVIEEQQDAHVSLIPDGCFDILFHLHESNPVAYLWTTPFSKKEQPFINVGEHYFGVRFWPEQTSIFFREHMHDLLEKVIPLHELLSFDFKIFELLRSSTSFEQRIRYFNQFLLSLKQQSSKETMLMKYVVDQLYKSHGTMSLSDIAATAGYSPQYMRRIFEWFIGLSPKQFAQIVQFQTTLYNIGEQQIVDLQELAFRAGYYDQAHFNRAFKKFMQTTPKKYVQQLQHAKQGVF